MMTSQQPVRASSGRRKVLYSAYDLVQTLVTTLVAVVLLFTFLVRVVAVEGDSMLPTLETRDRLLLTAFGETYERGDIVVVDRYTDDPLIKRVIAVAGDMVEIDTEYRLYVNGVLQQEDYIQGYTVRRDMTGPVRVPAGHLFVLGDNRTVSKDSRMAEIGMVSCKDVVGKVLFRIWPPKGFGQVD